MLEQKYYFHFLPLQAYQMLEFEVYIKNTDGQYIWANDFFLRQAAGVRAIEDIYLKDDRLFAWKDYADGLNSNDNFLLQNEASLSVREQVIRYEGTYINIISKKHPLYNEKQKIIGLIGFSMEIPKASMQISFTEREHACVSLLSAGYSDKEIGRKLKISPRTVEFHIKNAKQKYNVKSRAQLAVHFTDKMKTI